MALKNLTLRNFRGKTEVTYPFDPTRNLIEGRNGSGKSTIREAIAFLFCGTDSFGTRNPQHLITDDSDPQAVAEVMGVTDKATISRTLTRKGNGTLKVIREGIPSVYTQTQLEQMLGSTDLFLAVLVPGFFFSISSDRQHKVLAEVMPKIDRQKLFQDLAGFPLDGHRKVAYNLNGRCDLVASRVATDRRGIERELDEYEGRLRVYDKVEMLPKPEEPTVALAAYNRQVSLEREWEEYRRRSNAFLDRNHEIEKTTRSNAEKLRKREELQLAYDQLKLIDEPAADYPDTSALQAQRKSEPSRPALQEIVLEDRCTKCGSIVGSKHREVIAQDNEILLQRYREEADAVRAHNLKINTEIDSIILRCREADKKRQEIISENRKISEHKARLHLEITDLREDPVPEKLEHPAQPPEAYDPQAKATSTEVVDAYKAAKAQYEYAAKQFQEAQSKSAELRGSIGKYAAAVKELQIIEDTINKIPKAEMTIQAKALEMVSADISVGESIQLSRRGIPYETLSTGERMKADKEWSEKLNELMARPINMCFIDNAELIDHLPDNKKGVQYFLAAVKDGQDIVTINGKGE